MNCLARSLILKQMLSTEKKFGDPKAALNLWVRETVSRFSTPFDPQKKASTEGPYIALSCFSFPAISETA